MSKTREFDVIVWGATGFTGALVAEYLAKSQDSFKFAIAGRSQTKLNATRDKLKKINPAVVTIIIADSDDMKSLDAMVSRSKVVISTVGPYAKYGLKLVESCIKNHCDYVDLTGEPPFIREIVEKFHDEAVKNNVLIVPSCGILFNKLGFDSIPSDLGVYLIANEFKSKGLETASIRYALESASGGVSGGTVASLLNIVDSVPFSELRAMSSNPEYLNPDVIHSRKTWNGTLMTFDKLHNKWLSPFVMEAGNLRYVRRSNHILGYGSDFQYSEGASQSNVFFALLAVMGAIVGYILVAFPPVRWALARLVPPGAGPSESKRRNGHLHVTLVGESVKDSAGKAHVLKCTIKAKQDPGMLDLTQGYTETAKMISEAALCLALNRKEMERFGSFASMKGGVVTAASSMGLILVKRLQKAGMVMELEK